MKTSSGERNPVELLAEEFLDRKRRGERPTLQDYLDRHPELAEEIRDLFPALLMMEDLGESSGAATGSPAAEDGLASGPRPQTSQGGHVPAELRRVTPRNERKIPRACGQRPVVPGYVGRGPGSARSGGRWLPGPSPACPGRRRLGAGCVSFVTGADR